MPLLEVRGLTRTFGGLVALNQVDLAVEPGEVVGVIGPNGSGKTTLFNCITGLVPATRGAVLWFGSGTRSDLAGLPPHRVTTLGIARTFQNIRLFATMGVLDNVMVAQYCHARASLLEVLVRAPRLRREQREVAARAMELLEFVGLADHAYEIASALPYGLQRRLEIARALATRPKLLLLDEPAAGMNPQEIVDLLQLISRVHRLGITLLVIEHQMRLVMNLCQRIAVLDHGVKIAEGPPAQIQSDPRVISAYLGTEEHAEGF